MKNVTKHLMSSTTQQGRYVTQIIHFVHGYRKTIHDIDTWSIEQGQFTKFMLRDGRMMMINDANVLLVEVFPEKVLNEN
jgi:hypothetical protein